MKKNLTVLGKEGDKKSLHTSQLLIAKTKQLLEAL